MTQSLADKIAAQLQATFSPSHLQVIDESHQHAGHAEAGAAQDTHFRIIITADALAGRSRVAQHKAIYAALEEWIGNPIHALAIEVQR